MSVSDMLNRAARGVQGYAGDCHCYPMGRGPCELCLHAQADFANLRYLADAVDRWRDAHLTYHATAQPDWPTLHEARRARNALLDIILGEVELGRQAMEGKTTPLRDAMRTLKRSLTDPPADIEPSVPQSLVDMLEGRE